MSEFFRTAMGRKLIDGDIPNLVKVLERIAIQMEKSNKLEERKFVLEERIQKLTIKESSKHSSLQAPDLKPKYNARQSKPSK
tara:strand:+ start:258 stop:503 length:246 start_codon:yes stop_codon:yes gene_type:complete